MTDAIKKILRVSEEAGAYIDEVIIPSDIKGDDEAEMLYIREQNEGDPGLFFDMDDALNIAKEIFQAVDQKPLEKCIRDFVREGYGHSELESPSWDIPSLAKYIIKHLGDAS